MKPMFRVLALTAVLGVASLPVAYSSTVGACRYFCGTTIHEAYVGPTCCFQTFTCPNGQTSYPFAVHDGVWKVCRFSV